VLSDVPYVAKVATLGLRDDPCIDSWLNRLGESGRTAFYILKRFYREVLVEYPKFAGLSFSELVEWQSNAHGRAVYLIKSLAQQWINEQENLRFNSKRIYLSYISSAFMHNYAPLPPDPSFHFTSDKPPVVGKLTLEVFKRILHNCNKMYRAVFLLMAQSLMGENELIYVNEHHCKLIIDSLSKNAGIVKLVLPGRKRNRNRKNFYTMFSTNSDAGDALREYLKGCLEVPRNVLFHNAKKGPLAHYNIRQYFHQRAVEIGAIDQVTPNCPQCGGSTVRVHHVHPETKVQSIGYVCKECKKRTWSSELQWNFRGVRYGVNPHEIRDLMRTRWENTEAKSKVAEFMMGHFEQVDPNDYLDWMKYQRSTPLLEYRKALPWLNVLSREPEKVERAEVDSELTFLREKVSKLDREQAEIKRLLPTLMKGLDARERELKKKEKRN